MKKIAVIHFQPLEQFPPVMNCLDFLPDRLGGEYLIYVLTNSTGEGVNKYTNDKVHIVRISDRSKNRKRIQQAFSFFSFAIKSLFYLLKLNPSSILYYESHSALPVFLYKRYFNRKVNIFIHYHEYMSPADYLQSGMRFVNFSHRRESFLYSKAKWISHTNESRMNLFINDHKGIDIDTNCRKIMPNYPPSTWTTSRNGSGSSNTLPIKMVYVGSFGSLRELYIREFLTWVSKHENLFSLDIYSFNTSSEVTDFVDGLGSSNIRLKKAVDYNELPSVLGQYRVGLILYKGLTLNFKHNVPNKFFEYLACGLDVWFPKEMVECLEFVREDVYPKVVQLKFDCLDEFNHSKATNREGLTMEPSVFFCEKVLEPLAQKLLTVTNH